MALLIAGLWQHRLGIAEIVQLVPVPAAKSWAVVAANHVLWGRLPQRLGHCPRFDAHATALATGITHSGRHGLQITLAVAHHVPRVCSVDR